MSRESEVEIVNPVPVDEALAWTRAEATTFLEDPDSSSVRRWQDIHVRTWDPARNWGARDGGRWVGTLATEPRSLTVPGLDDRTREMGIDAVTAVTVAATHRRRGLMSRMVEAALRAARDRGDAISALISAEWPIYGRFGFAPATLSANYILRRSHPGSALEGDPARVYQVNREEFAGHAAAVFAAARARYPGQIDRPGDWWSQHIGGNGFEPPTSGLPAVWLLHEGPDGPDGLLAWRAEGERGPDNPGPTVTVSTFAAASDDAYRNMWAYLSGIDGADEVVVSNRPVDEPVRWLLRDGRTLVMNRQFDMLWLRILDVPATLSSRRYQAPGDVVLEVVDDRAGGHAAGRYRLAAETTRCAARPPAPTRTSRSHRPRSRRSFSAASACGHSGWPARWPSAPPALPPWSTGCSPRQ